MGKGKLSKNLKVKLKAKTLLYLSIDFKVFKIYL